jgi:hypothetical protein
VPDSPPGPWGTSPVGSPRPKDGTPLRYGTLGGDSDTSWE